MRVFAINLELGRCVAGDSASSKKMFQLFGPGRRLLSLEDFSIKTRK